MCLSCDVHIHVAIHMHTFFIFIYIYIGDIFVIYLQIHIFIYTHTHLFLIFRERWLFACMVDIIYSPEMILVVDTFTHGVPVVAIVVAWAATHHVWSRRPETWWISLRNACCEHGHDIYIYIYIPKCTTLTLAYIWPRRLHIYFRISHWWRINGCKAVGETHVFWDLD